MRHETFMKNYAKLKAFFDEHGHSDVKARGGSGLGHFVSTTRTLYRRQNEVGRRLLSDECIADLNKINFIFIKSKCRKSEKFKKLVRGIKTFRKHYKHVNIDSTSESAMPKGCEDLKDLLSWARNAKLGRDRIEDLRVTLHFSLEPTSTDQSRHLTISDLLEVDDNADTFAPPTSRTFTTTIAASSSPHSSTLTPSATSMVGPKPSDTDAIMMPSNDFFPNNSGEDENENSLTNVVHERSRVEESYQTTFDSNINSSTRQECSNNQANGQAAKKKTAKNNKIKRKARNLPLKLADVNIRAEEIAPRRRGLRSSASRLSSKR